MKYELTWLSHFINVVVAPDNLTSPPSQENMADWLTACENETARLSNTLISKVYQESEVDKCTRYIQSHHAALVHLVEVVERYANETSNQESPVSLNANFYKKIAGLLDGVQDQLQSLLERYIDPDLPIPHVLGKLLKTELDKILPKLERIVTGSPIEAPLWVIPLRPIRSFVGEQSKISYRKALYLKKLAADLLEFKEIEADHHADQYFHEMLFRANFNTPEYVFYCTSALERKLRSSERADNSTAKREFLSWYIKVIQQQPIRVDMAFVPGLPTVADQVLHWIREEYRFIAESDKSPAETPPPSLKLKTSLPVATNAALFRLLTLNGILTNDSKIEIIRFASWYVTTPKVDSISEDSFRSKFYNPDAEALNAVKDLAIGLINTANKLEKRR